MKLHHMAAVVLGAALAPSLATAQSSSQVSLCVTTGIGSCGNLCEPFQCLPSYTLAVVGEQIHFDIGGRIGTPFVLFVGTPVVGCQTVTGVAGQLAAWAPISAFQTGMIWEGKSTPCGLGSAEYDLVIPGTAPLGFSVRFQVLGVDSNATSEWLSFSRPVELRVH